MSFIKLDDASIKGKRLIAQDRIAQGSIFHKITDYRLTHSPSFTSVQIAVDLHIEEIYLSSLNHSCVPNVAIDVNKLELWAIREIEAGEELTFFYPSTEWEMSAPFHCLCQSASCLKIIAGAKYCSADLLSQYTLSRHISAQLSQTINEFNLSPVEQVTSRTTGWTSLV